jgi:5,10-methylenetetrahydrofolate reductase
VYSEQDQRDFLTATHPSQRFHTIATCRHNTFNSLLDRASSIAESGSNHGTILLVGGNDKTSTTTISTIQAAKFLKNELDVTLFGVTNPNDPESVMDVEKKLDAGIEGIITQPLLSSCAFETLHMYREIRSSSKNNHKDFTIVAGLAFPKTAKGLQFWAKLLQQEDELCRDPLFRSHLAFFSQPYYTPLSWIGRELHELLQLMSSSSSSSSPKDHTSPKNGDVVASSSLSSSVIDGIHFMPLKNMQDLCTIFESLKRIDAIGPLPPPSPASATH